ncbi:MAG: CehA/McbA family metallohydrolase [Deltaproteobacteria bacterium]|nr:CehA/McbA family metallohydrolase [Deltaproteobacteria bacterium]
MNTSRYRLSMLVALAGFAASCSPAPRAPFASAFQIERLDQAIGGPKALAQPGDFLLENESLRIAVIGSRVSMGPGVYGGVLVDADLQWDSPETSGGHGRDQFGELDPTVNLNLADPVGDAGVTIVEDGSGGRAVVRVQGEARPFLTLMGALWGLVGAPDFHLVTDYIVEAGVPWVTLKTTAIASWDGVGVLPTEGEPVTYSDDGLPIIDWAVESGLALGEFYLSGGSVDMFAPGLGFDEDSDVYDAWKEERNTFSDPFQFPFLVGVGDGISYGIAPAEGDLYVPLFTAGQTAAIGGGVAGDGTAERFAPGSAYTYERYFFIGHGDVGSVVDLWVEALHKPYGEVRGAVFEQGTAAPLSGAQVFVYQPGADRPWSQWKTDVDPRDERLDGSFGGRLPVGEWELVAHAEGRPTGDRVPVTVTDGGQVELGLSLERQGRVDFYTWDEADRALPAKVSVFRVDEAPWRDPVLGDGYIAGHPEDVLFSLDGHSTGWLPEGRYHAVATRGPEYELGIADFEVRGVDALRVDLGVHHAVDTPGWVSGDFHNHSDVSHDSGLSSEMRVTSMVCEGVEFFPSTDHDYIRDHRPTVEALGAERWVRTVPGEEVTTLELGHHIGWPLAVDSIADSGGAIDWTDMTPQEIHAALREKGSQGGYDPVVIVPHPRSGILGYFDQFGFSPYGGTVGVPGAAGTPLIQTPMLSLTNPLLKAENLDWDFDAMELFNGKSLRYARTPTQAELDAYAAGEPVSAYDLLVRTPEEQEALTSGETTLGFGHKGQIEDWFTLLNLGYRITGVGSSDSHSATGIESGCPRNYIASDTDSPAELSGQDLADAVKEHRVMVTYGPFLQLTVDGAPIGAELVPAGPEIEVAVSVQTPSWMDLDRVQLYENGVLIHEWTVAPREGEALDFHQTLALNPARDAWYVAMAMGDGGMEPLYTPVEIPYIELQAVVTQALSGVQAISRFLSDPVPIPLEHSLYPFALTNPVWVDLQGDGFSAPGLPSWMVEPVDPNAEG